MSVAGSENETALLMHTHTQTYTQSCATLVAPPYVHNGQNVTHTTREREMEKRAAAAAEAVGEHCQYVVVCQSINNCDNKPLFHR